MLKKNKNQSLLPFIHTHIYIILILVYFSILPYTMSFPGGSEVKVSACNTGDLGSIPGSGRSPGGGSGNPLQYSCLETPMDRGTWQATVHGVAKSLTRPSTHTHTHTGQSRGHRPFLTHPTGLGVAGNEGPTG